MINFPFQEWLTINNLVGGDWRYFWPENIQRILSYLFAWDSSLNAGLGRSNIPLLWINSYLSLGANFFTNILHIPWNISEKLLFFWPIVLFSFLSAFFLSRIFFKKAILNILSGIIYLTNTYALMIFSGGQVGVGLAYSVAPLVLLSFIRLINLFSVSSQTTRHKILNAKYPLGAGMILALQVLFDPRIAVLSIIMAAVYFLFVVRELKIKTETFIFILFIPGIVVFLLHAFWLLPILLSRLNPVAAQFDVTTLSSGLVRFFSFANFENTISLLHPNWPDNIFGKAYFMRPEFILLPITVFSPLLFIKNLEREKKKYILFFSSLALLGAFLAKGTNPPFGGIYVWFVDHFQLFAMFRDSTKWYVLIAVSYSILIPLSLNLISDKIFKRRTLSVIAVIFIFFLFFLLRPAFLGQVKGTFAKHEVPESYVQLKNFLALEPEFFRTLWIPKTQRFAFLSDNHPAISQEELIGAYDAKTISKISQEETLLQEAGVKYLIVPFDSEGEIFLTDRKYDNKQYETLVKNIGKIAFLKKVGEFGKIVVFQVPTPKNHFFLNDVTSLTQLTYERKNPADYLVTVQGGKKGELLVFSERYDNNWVAKVKNKQIPTARFDGLFNSFILPENGDYSLEIFYTPQRFVAIGYIVSFVSLVSLSLAFLLLLLKRKEV